MAQRLNSTFVLLVLLTFAAFKGSAQNQSGGRLGKALTGEWYNIYVRIDVTDSGRQQVVEADSSNWEARLKIKPIHTRFYPDGSYTSVYHDLRDSIVMTKTGTWTLKGDTIIMTQQSPVQTSMRLRLSITGKRATFTGLIDFNGDGKADDKYYGIQRKV